MKRRTSPSRSASAQNKTLRPLQLIWSHLGTLHRVSLWPEVSFAYQDNSTWIEWEPNPANASFASGATMIDARKWAAYAEFLPAAQREFIETYKHGRLAALAVISRCPELQDEIIEHPALMHFIANHLQLRGGDAPQWREMSAIHANGGLFELLAWLGLPASRQTLEILDHIAEPDLPKRLLIPLRAALWEPETLWALQRSESLTTEILQARCHALAA